MSRYCIVCGNEITSGRSDKIICSDICKKSRHVYTTKLWRKENADYKICIICGESYRNWPSHRTVCQACQKSNAYTLNKDKSRRFRNRRRDDTIKYQIKSQLKSELGITPPPELVEEATAVRLLRGAIRKAEE